MKSLMLLSLVVTQECGDIVGVSTARDCKTITSRFEHEGMSFLTITLPQFAKDFEKSLDRREVRRDVFQPFGWYAGFPKFLSGFLAKVFDRGTGRLLDDACPYAIQAVRQITLLHSKIEIDCTPERVKSAIDGYIQCEAEVKVSDSLLSEGMVDEFVYYCNLLFRDVFLDMEETLFKGYLTPKHGPGKTAERISGNLKYASRSWTSRLESVFPARDHLVPGHHYSDELDAVTWAEPETETPVRVVTVPKTPKRPRIIAIEPVPMQYMQQAVLRCFLGAYSRDDFLPSIIGFDDQPPNQRMAQEGSLTGSLATLDLSEASDRVSNLHVGLVFRRHRLLAEAVEVTRSLKADVPGHGIISLSKFASMGSAMTFAMEAIVFTTIIFMAIGSTQSRRLTRGSLMEYLGKVRVYGDDLVVPNDIAPVVVEFLESYGYKVNSSKSFWSGSFRESCGKEYFKGNDVSVVKTRLVFPASRADAHEVSSIVALRNLMYNQGMWSTARWLDDRIKKLIPFPIVHDTCAGLGRSSFLSRSQKTWTPQGNLGPEIFISDRVEIGKSKQRPLVRVAYQTDKSPLSDIESDGVSSLLKWFLKQGEDPFELGSYKRQGRPDTVDIKVRWMSPF